ncbi:hypothetical protein Syun_026776 [Stephania yunnanensis]|uniref:HMA domain-containing protein n=1 Tax=Stephania yunnanensis TaxID=152371 RepID=A0AAP0EGN1_9MAGN
MAEKMSVLLLKVDLDCSKCYNRIRKTLCQLHSEIRSQTWDTKQNIVIIAGPFDAQEMSMKIKYRAGKVVKDIEIKGGGDAKPKAAPPAEKKADGGGEKPPPADKKADGGEKPPAAGKPAGKAEKAPAEKAAAAAPAPPKEEAAAAKPAAEMKMLHEPMHTVVAYPIVQPPYGMYYEGYQHDQGPPPYYNYNYNGYNARPVYNNNYHGVMSRGYNNVHGADYFSEENPACTIM